MEANNTETAPVYTVNDILAKYERDCLPSLAPRTIKDYTRHIVKLRRAFGDRIAEELKPKDFAPFLGVPKAKGYIQRCRQIAVLSAAFTQAVSYWFWIDRNILRDVKRQKNDPRDRLVSDEEFEAFKATVPPRMKLGMMLAALTGQRQGDLLLWKWSDIREAIIPDPAHPGQMRVINEWRLCQGKTKKRLGIEITPKLDAVLDQCYLLKAGGHQGCAYVLPTRRGEPYTGEGFRAVWQRAMRKWARLGNERFRYHDLRAYAATKCKTVEEAQRLLGHADPKITLAVYRRGIERAQPPAI